VITTLITAIHVFVCLMLIGIILLQQGKGASMGAAFGGGGGTLFGAAGADTFMTNLTKWVAIIFMVTSLALATRSLPSVENLNDGSLSKILPSQASLSPTLGSEAAPADGKTSDKQQAPASANAASSTPADAQAPTVPSEKTVATDNPATPPVPTGSAPNNSSAQAAP